MSRSKKIENNMKTVHICKLCNKQFLDSPSQKRVYCSKKCKESNPSKLLGSKTKLLWQDPNYRKMMSEKHKGQCRPHTEETKKKIGDSHRGEKSVNWKGGVAWYSKIHGWIESQLGKPKKCEKCGTIISTKYEWSNISGKYKEDIIDWQRLCSKCHHKFDNITKRGWVTRKSPNYLINQHFKLENKTICS